MSHKETIVVNLNDYRGQCHNRVQIHATQQENPKIWDITISSMEGIWYGDGVYVAEHGRGIEDCDAQFTEGDYRIMESALGLMVLQLEEDKEFYAGVKEDRERERLLDAADYKYR